MCTQLDMKEIERQAYMSYHEDGLIDIAIGIVFAAWGILLAVSLPALIGLLGLVAIGIWYAGKRFLTIPRTGILKPSQKMQSRLNNLAVFMLVLGLAALVGVLLSILSRSDLLADHSLGLVGLLVAVGISIGAFVLNANRLYAYALLLFAAFAGGEILNANVSAFDAFILSVILAGTLIMLSGLVVLIRFLRRYPLPVIEG